MKKKILVFMITFACVMDMAVVASVGTVNFDVTVTAHGVLDQELYGY